MGEDEDGCLHYPDKEYDVAQICLNGHVVNDRFRVAPERSRKHCPDCGAPTITQCGECDALIPGFFFRYRVSPDHRAHFQHGDSLREAPRFCSDCGKPYPWTSARLEAASQFIIELEDLTPDERTKLVESLPDIVRETPRTDLAVHRFKRGISKIKKPGSEIMLRFLTELAATGAARLLGLDARSA